jgi:acetyl esterase/lipase
MMTDIGAPVNYHEYEDMFHVWPLLPVPEGKQAMGEIVAFMTAS